MEMNNKDFLRLNQSLVYIRGSFSKNTHNIDLLNLDKYKDVFIFDENNLDLIIRYDVLTLPTILYFKKGKLVKRLVGDFNLEDIKELGFIFK